MEPRTEDIFHQFGDELRSFIHKRVSDDFIAEDILQEVFLKIHTGIEKIRDNTKIRSWVYRIARNTVIDHYRTDKIEEDLPAEIPVPGGEFREGSQEVLSRGIKALISLLPDIYRDALMLTEFEGLDQKELARRMGLSHPGARSRVQRGREMLKKLILEYCHFEFDRWGTLIDIQPKACPRCNAGLKKQQ